MKKPRIYFTLGRRFVVIASVTFFIPLIIFALFASRNYSAAVNLKLEQMTDTTLGLIDKNIDSIIRDVESTSNLITTNQFTQSLLLEKNPEKYTLDYRQKEVTVKNLLINVTNNKHFFDLVYLGNQYTSLTKYKSSIASEPIEDYQNLTGTSWYQELLDLRGKGIWYKGSDILGFSDNILVYAKAILNMNNPRPIGILLVGIGESPFSDIFSNEQVDFSSKILISQNDKIIFEYSPKDDPLLLSLTPEDNQKLLHAEGITDVSKRVYVRHIENKSSGWKITGVVPYKVFLAEKKNSNIFFFLTAFLCFAIGVFLMSLFSRNMTQTLNMLSHYVDALRKGKPTKDIAFSDRDEIGLIGNELVRVVSENQKLMENLYQSMYKEKEAELMALQAQINPHFLYNTLDSIFWTAQEYHAEEIGNMVVALSNVFKLSLNNGQKLISLKQELELVKNYLAIQQMRFGNTLRTDIRLPASLQDVLILKFLIQPLVENSIQHGLSDKNMVGLIKVYALSEEPYLKIFVEDDGCGFSCPFEEALKKGFALRNIEERIKLYYGEDCGIFMDTEVSAGCRLMLKLKTE